MLLIFKNIKQLSHQACQANWTLPWSRPFLRKVEVNLLSQNANNPEFYLKTVLLYASHLSLGKNYYLY